MPDPQTISAAKLSALTGLSDRRHRELAKDGYFPPPTKGQYIVAPTVSGLFRYFRENHNRSKFPVFESIGSAASAIGCTEAMLKTAKRKGCPAFLTGSRVDSSIVIPFLFGLIAKGSEIPEGFTSWKEVLEAEKARRETIRRKTDERETMPTVEARRQNGEAWAFVFAELDRLSMEYAAALSGLPPIEIHERLCAFREKLRADAKSKFESAA